MKVRKLKALDMERSLQTWCKGIYIHSQSHTSFIVTSLVVIHIDDTELLDNLSFFYKIRAINYYDFFGGGSSEIIMCKIITYNDVDDFLFIVLILCLIAIFN